MSIDEFNDWFLRVGWILLTFGFSGALVLLFQNRETIVGAFEIIGVLFTGTIIALVFGEPIGNFFHLPMVISGFACGLGGKYAAEKLIGLIKIKIDSTAKTIEQKTDERTTE